MLLILVDPTKLRKVILILKNCIIKAGINSTEEVKNQEKYYFRPPRILEKLLIEQKDANLVDFYWSERIKLTSILQNISCIFYLDNNEYMALHIPSLKFKWLLYPDDCSLMKLGISDYELLDLTEFNQLYSVVGTGRKNSKGSKFELIYRNLNFKEAEETQFDDYLGIKIENIQIYFLNKRIMELVEYIRFRILSIFDEDPPKISFKQSNDQVYDGSKTKNDKKFSKQRVDEDMIFNNNHNLKRGRDLFTHSSDKKSNIKNKKVIHHQILPSRPKPRTLYLEIALDRPLIIFPRSTLSYQALIAEAEKISFINTGPWKTQVYGLMKNFKFPEEVLERDVFTDVNFKKSRRKSFKGESILNMGSVLLKHSSSNQFNSSNYDGGNNQKYPQNCFSSDSNRIEDRIFKLFIENLRIKSCQNVSANSLNIQQLDENDILLDLKSINQIKIINSGEGLSFKTSLVIMIKDAIINLYDDDYYILIKTFEENMLESYRTLRYLEPGFKDMRKQDHVYLDVKVNILYAMIKLFEYERNAFKFEGSMKRGNKRGNLKNEQSLAAFPIEKLEIFVEKQVCDLKEISIIAKGIDLFDYRMRSKIRLKEIKRSNKDSSQNFNINMDTGIDPRRKYSNGINNEVLSGEKNLISKKNVIFDISPHFKQKIMETQKNRKVITFFM